MLLARNAEAAGDNAGAAAYFQRVFYDYPVSKEAEDAEIALERLKGVLGRKLPAADAAGSVGACGKAHPRR